MDEEIYMEQIHKQQMEEKAAEEAYYRKVAQREYALKLTKDDTLRLSERQKELVRELIKWKQAGWRCLFIDDNLHSAEDCANKWKEVERKLGLNDD